MTGACFHEPSTTARNQVRRQRLLLVLAVVSIVAVPRVRFDNRSFWQLIHKRRRYGRVQRAATEHVETAAAWDDRRRSVIAGAPGKG